MKIYLIDVEKLQDKNTGDELSERARLLIDDYRRLKADKCKSPVTRGPALGAGLALQLAAIGYTRDDQAENERIVLTAEEAVKVLDGYGEVIDLSYDLGDNGKPYLTQGQMIPAFKNHVPFISISHSGKYAALAVSDFETGIDLQKKKAVDTDKLSERFFTERESDEVRRDPEMFFWLWARKEAWGKCEGCGIGPALKKDLTDIHNGYSASYRWIEEELPEEYVLCVCEKRS